MSAGERVENGANLPLASEVRLLEDTSKTRPFAGPSPRKMVGTATSSSGARVVSALPDRLSSCSGVAADPSGVGAAVSWQKASCRAISPEALASAAPSTSGGCGCCPSGFCVRSRPCNCGSCPSTAPSMCVITLLPRSRYSSDAGSSPAVSAVSAVSAFPKKLSTRVVFGSGGMAVKPLMLQST